MKTKEIVKRICAVFIITGMIGTYCLDAGYIQARTNMLECSLTEELESPTGMIQTDREESVSGTEKGWGGSQKETRDYIVKTKYPRGLIKMKKTYSESDEINENKQDLLKENNIISVELPDSEIDALAEQDSIVYVEEDAVVEASARKPEEKKGYIKNKKPHKMKQKHRKENTSSTEWNVRMIKANKKITNPVSENTERIKVAVLDSGIDWGNDINLVYQISLVPGEEEMTQVFMDGTGHGSSVASLIAADDNNDGITGISRDVDIYSYRVLDDENKAPVSRVVEAIYMAIEQKVHIINMSFGLDEYSEALKEAVHAAEEAGILVIAAAGNTGSRGVQYPAAYDEVMAVGAVNKEGLVEDYSARGDQVEIVAPGELVRTTGFIGSEEVTSGTSLAAPQITAVAVLIWQKDTKVSADFVRGLLNESANLYGKTDEYGNGLVDAEYALKHYEEYKRKYEESEEKTKLLIPENQSEIITFEDTGCVEGSWSKDDHEKLIDSGKYCVRAGARFPDLSGVKKFTYGGKSYEFDMGSKTGNVDNRKFAGMTKSPWWHGYFENNNYIQAAIYATRIADAINAYGNYNLANDTVGYTRYLRAGDMRNSINYLYENSERGWKYALRYMQDRNSGNSGAQSQKNTNGFKRAFVWGMAIHTATDAYAHSTEDRNGRIKHTGDYYDADRVDYIKNRYLNATSVAKQMMSKYTSKGELIARDLMMPGNYTAGYKMINYANYIQAVDASITGYTYWFSTK